MIVRDTCISLPTMCIAYLCTFILIDSYIRGHQRADKINSYVAQKMYAFPIADGDATCRMCSKEEQVPGRGA